MELASADIRAAVGERLALYAHAIDRRRYALLAEVFHDDATVRFGRIDGSWRDFVAHADRLLAPIGRTHHQIGNLLVRAEADVAFSECYVTAHHHVPANAPTEHSLPGRGHPYVVMIGARYLDRFERRGDGWRIAARHGLYDWRTDMPLANDGGLSDMPTAWLGGWGDADASRTLVAPLL